ncbi:helix-turn-helix transcriptional regulator [Pseudoalteromonas xiamenensis]
MHDARPDPKDFAKDFDDKHHRALSDAKNAAKILNLLLQPELSETMSKNKKLDVDALVKGRLSIDILILTGFVDIPDKKQALHPARYFEALFLPKLKAKGVSDIDISTRLGIPEQLYLDFLGEKVSITSGFANKLEALTGMRAEFWLRAQRKFHD